MVIDPAERVIWLGETQAFMGSAGVVDGGNGLNVVGTNGVNEGTITFNKNFAALIVNGAMDGSHFTDILREDFSYPLWNDPEDARPLWILGGRDGGSYPLKDLMKP